MDANEETIARIKSAYLSDKNIDSVLEQLLFEMKTAKIDYERMYSAKFLRNFLSSMMNYLFHEARAKLGNKNYLANFVGNPKKSILLLDGIAIHKVLEQIKKQVASLPKVGLTPMPTVLNSLGAKMQSQIRPPSWSTYDGRSSLPQNVSARPMPVPSHFVHAQAIPWGIPPYMQTQPSTVASAMPRPRQPWQPSQPSQPWQLWQPSQSSQPWQQNFPKKGSRSLATSIDELFPVKKKKKNAVSVKALDKRSNKGEFEEHEWWKRKRDQSVRELDLLDNDDANGSRHRPDVLSNLPWKLVSISSAERNVEEFPSTSRYSVPVSLDGVVSATLHSVQIPIERKTVTEGNNMFYYSEDDDEMQILTVKSTDALQSLQDVIDSLQDIADRMTSNSTKYRYVLTLNRHTGRVKIAQVLQAGVGQNRLHLYFEQTRRNCATLLGFDRIDYRDRNEYEGNHEHEAFRNETRLINVYVDELSMQVPVLTLRVKRGRENKVHQFAGNDIFWQSENGSQGTDIDRLTVTFVDDDGETADVGPQDHVLTFKFFYQPYRSTCTTNAESCPLPIANSRYAYDATVDSDFVDQIRDECCTTLEISHPASTTADESAFPSGHEYRTCSPPPAALPETLSYPRSIGSAEEMQDHRPSTKKTRLPTLDI